MMWRTSAGHVLDMKDMTDVHLENALAMCKRENRKREADLLIFERARRRHNEFMAQTEPCRYCDGTMTMIYIEFDREGPKWGGEHRLRCEKCGALSDCRIKKKGGLT